MPYIPYILNASIPLGIVGGIIFALHLRPSRVWLARSIGAALGILAVLCALTFVVVDRLMNGSTELWLVLAIALVPSAGLWLVTAYFTDLLNGGRIFGHSRIAFEIIEDE